MKTLRYLFFVLSALLIGGCVPTQNTAGFGGGGTIPYKTLDGTAPEHVRAMEQQCFNEVNSWRAQNGMSTLRVVNGPSGVGISRHLSTAILHAGARVGSNLTGAVALVGLIAQPFAQAKRRDADEAIGQMAQCVQQKMQSYQTQQMRQMLQQGGISYTGPPPGAR